MSVIDINPEKYEYNFGMIRVGSAYSKQCILVKYDVSICYNVLESQKFDYVYIHFLLLPST